MSDPTDCSTPGFPVLHYLLELSQTHVSWVSDAIQPSHPLSPTPSPQPPTFSSCPQSFPASGSFPWAGSSYQIATILEFQLLVGVSVLLKNIQGWFLLELNCLISLQSKGLSRVFSNTAIWKYYISFFICIYHIYFYMFILYLYVSMYMSRYILYTCIYVKYFCIYIFVYKALSHNIFSFCHCNVLHILLCVCVCVCVYLLGFKEEKLKNTKSLTC